MENKRGFTLLELLVVVLIIGILAGIALPQYRNAVRKARVAEAKITLRAIVDATDRYVLTTGNTTANISDLDVEISSEFKNWNMYIDECLCGSENINICGCVVTADPKWEPISYYISYWSVNYDGGEDAGFNGNFTCIVNGDNNGHTICRSLGGQLIEGRDDVYQI